jgi:nicotinamidase/pyrazinamidase
MMNKLEAHLLVIDPQNDFCDLPEAYRPELPSGTRMAPALPVAGAHDDMLRIAALVRRCGDALSQITITLDAHQHLDIAHPTFWKAADGGAVPPFTQIGAADVEAGRFRVRAEGAQARVLDYLRALEGLGRYRHMVWPVHCEIGSWGQGVHQDLQRAYNAWEERHLTTVHKVMKGQNPWTEHYSAIQAEVPDASDAGTGVNTDLLARLRDSDRIYVTGEAGSHCVRATTEHLVAALTQAEVAKVVLVTDCMSPVAGFEAAYRGFLDDMRARGVRQLTALEVERELGV